MDIVDCNGQDLLEHSSEAIVASRSGDMRVGPLIPIPEALVERGIDPQIAFARAGVDLRLFQNPDSRIPYEAAARLLEVCAALTGDRHFALLVGERFDLAKLGPIGELMRHSASVGDALGVLLRYLPLQDRGATAILLAPDDTTALLGYSILRHGMPGAEQIYDVAISIGYKILRELCGASFAPQRVQFSYSRPRVVAPYGRLFRSDVSFDADFSGIVFNSCWLLQPLKGAEAKMRSRLEKAILEAEASGPMSFGERVESALHQLVLNGEFSSEAVAALFSIHERKLRRLLREEGKSLRQLINRTRYELARQLLSNTAMPVTEIAAALHYADPNAFSRAFRVWARLSPAQWRALDGERDSEAVPIAE